LGLLACGGSDSPTDPSPAVAFSPDGAASAATFSLRSGSGTRGSRLQLELVATGVTNLHSLSFVLTLPSNVVRLSGQSQGPFLAQNGVTPLLLVLQLPAPFQGALVTDARPNGTAAVSGSGVVMTLELEAVANGSGRITLDSAEASDAQDQPIGGLRWIGGTVTVNR
jgi:hypothetical protein